MSLTPVQFHCPHCGREYRIAVDVDKLQRVRKRAVCGRCKKTFDVGQRLTVARNSMPAPAPVTEPPAEPSAPAATASSPAPARTARRKQRLVVEEVVVRDRRSRRGGVAAWVDPQEAPTPPAGVHAGEIAAEAATAQPRRRPTLSGWHTTPRPGSAAPMDGGAPDSRTTNPARGPVQPLTLPEPIYSEPPMMIDSAVLEPLTPVPPPIPGAPPPPSWLDLADPGLDGLGADRDETVSALSALLSEGLDTAVTTLV